jgi:alkanesulfonate monooxygenase SsuD/methylene tetrahydromethanopterin reductase-like flavin-dependent oxidoreductase (luciferase family)
MDFGLFYEIPVARPWNPRSEHEAYKNTIAQAVLADELGFHSFWTVEHHFLEEFSHCSAPGVLYGAIAARTRNLRIGHGVRLLPFPYNHPIRAAEAAAVLDLICDGRLEFGTGRSATRAELEGFGIRPDDTRSLWEEALQMIVGAWTEDVFSWSGKHFQLPPRRVIPKPLQRPHPPLWVATTSAESHEIAGRKGLGLLSFTIGVPPEELAQRIRLYRKGLEQATPIGKFANTTAATFTMVHCAETTAAAKADAAESFEWYVKRGTEQIATVGQWQAELERGFATYEYTKAIAGMDPSFLTFDFLDKLGACIVGDPDRCVEIARRYQAAGCELLLCLVQPYKIPHQKVMRSIELLGKHVLPEFSKRRP